MRPSILTLPLLAASLCACGGGSSDPVTATGELVVEATDKPFAFDIVADARVRVREVQVQREAASDDGFLTLYAGPGIELDLLDLNNGVTHLLVRADVPVGSYRQVRLKIDSARLELENGNVYSTALGNLKMTSLPTSGLKVFIDPPVEVRSELSTTLLLDFDLTKTFHPIPSNDPLAASSYKLQPVIHATNRTLTGEIRGSVLADDGTGVLVGVGQATVYVQPPGDPDPANSVAATGTLDDGSYAVIGLLPGTYDVLAVKDPLSGLVAGKGVLQGNVTPVDVTIQ